MHATPETVTDTVMAPVAISGSISGSISETAQLRTGLELANQRIHELEASLKSLREELRQKHPRRCRSDFSWLAMA